MEDSSPASFDYLITLAQASTDSASDEFGNTAATNESLTTKYYYGADGKRAAVTRFLTDVRKEETPQTLLLFSDEEMSWLYEDKSFAKEWALLLKEVLEKGNRIKIIHTVGRTMNELLEAVTKWVPIYSTGSIEPYYYPKLRDGLFQRTLFVAPRTAAIISTSVQQKTDNMLNSYIVDKKAIAALSEDFGNYLQVCRPLMRISNANTPEALKKLYTDLFAAWGSFSTFSDETEGQSALLGIGVGEPDSVEHAAHIQTISSLLKSCEEFTVVSSNSIDPNMILLVLENTGVMMINTRRPYCMFSFSEQTMVNAFWDYLLNLKNRIKSSRG